MTTIRSVAAQRASLSTRVANTWELLLVDDTYADSDTFEDLTDVTAYEVTGGGYARDILTGLSWDATGDVPAVKLDDADVPGTGPDATGAWIVDTDDDKLLFFVDFESTITLSGSLPIEWAGGSIALYDDTSADVDAVEVRVGTLESNSDTTGSTAGHVWTVVTPGSPAEFQALPAPAGGGATGFTSIDKSGETPGTISVDATAIADDVATLVVVAPSGGASTLEVLLPDGTGRAPLLVIAYADDGSLLTLSFPSAPGALVTAPAVIASAVIGSTPVMTPLDLQGRYFPAIPASWFSSPTEMSYAEALDEAIARIVALEP